MPRLIRRIRKARWTLQAWLGEGELPSDVFLDLNSKDNTLSLWLVEDDNSNLNRVLAAMAAQGSPDAFDYAVLDKARLEACGFVLERVDGATPDSDANRQWHFDAKQLSTRLLQVLADELKNGIQDRVSPASVKKAVIESIALGQLVVDSMPQRARWEL